MASKHLAWAVLTAIALVLTSWGCQLVGAPRPTPPSYPAWLSKWLTAPTCQPPCWENITPGTTVFTDAVHIVQRLPAISILWGPGIDQWGSQQMEWDFGSISTGRQDQVISNIVLSIRNGSEPTLEAAIAAYGKPSHVLLTDCRGHQCVAIVIYDQKGMLLHSLMATDLFGHTVNIQPTIPIGAVEFFTPGISGQPLVDALAKASLAFPNEFTEWKGYGDYARK
jgi:hypothetical protein